LKEDLCINAIRLLSADAIEKANSGHPGLPLGAAPMAYTLWTKQMNHNPKNPNWFNRDRFILSAGHGSSLLYSLLYLTGYDVSIQDIQNFRQLNSKTPGHPEYGVTPGVEATTGPLGQGVAMSVGMAIAERFLAELFNRDNMQVINHHTYALISDGDLMEGVSYEAASLAGRLRLGRLIYLYDDNNISIDGETNLTFTENIKKRFEACDWQVLEVKDGNDTNSIDAAIKEAKKEKDKPSIIIVKTHIGYGSPKQDSSSSHGAPLGKDALQATKDFFGYPKDSSFHVPDEARRECRKTATKGSDKEADWNKLFNRYKQEYTAESQILEALMQGELPKHWDYGMSELVFTPENGALATRDASGKIMNVIAKHMPNFLGGSADLAASVKTLLKDFDIFDLKSSDKATGRNIYFGIREHAMGAIVNGMALHGGVVPYASTFFVFSDYIKPSLRMSALMDTHSIFVFSHDSIGVGEDGPTHQPIEHLVALRSLPNMTVIRPADANETVTAWRIAIERQKPVSLILSRQKLPILDIEPDTLCEGVRKGAYVLSDCEGTPDIIIIATGSEVNLADRAQQQLSDKGVKTRVVSMPSWELFAEQTEEYKESVLPSKVKARLAIEAGVPFGWERWVGAKGEIIGIDQFGVSAPGELLFEKFGFTIENVIDKALQLLKK